MQASVQAEGYVGGMQGGARAWMFLLQNARDECCPVVTRSQGPEKVFSIVSAKYAG